MTFPGCIKGCANVLRVSSSHIFRAGQTDSLPHSFQQQNRPSLTSRAHSTMGQCSFWRLFLFHYSFFLDQLVLETSGWILNSCSNIRNCFLSFVRLTVQGLSFWLTLKLLKLINILIHIPVFSFLLNVTGQTIICLCC